MSYLKIKNSAMIDLGNDHVIYMENNGTSSWRTHTGAIAMNWDGVFMIDCVSRTIEELEKRYVGVLQSVKDHYVNEYKPEDFGWYAGVAVGNKHTTSTTERDYFNLFKRAKKRIIPWDKVNDKMSISITYYDNKHDKLFGETISLEKYITNGYNVETKEIENCANIVYSLNVFYMFDDFLKKHNEGIRRNHHLINNYYVIKGEWNYFIKKNKATSSHTEAKRFKTLKDARKIAQKYYNVYDIYQVNDSVLNIKETETMGE